MAITVEHRIKIEKKIVKKCIQEGLKAGYTFGVHDGEEIVLRREKNPNKVLKAMFSTDEDTLLFFKDDKQFGWISFVYGNDGWDVMNDWTTNLDPILVEVNKLVDKIELFVTMKQ